MASGSASHRFLQGHEGVSGPFRGWEGSMRPALARILPLITLASEIPLASPGQLSAFGICFHSG